jgi:hypothetical protein
MTWLAASPNDRDRPWPTPQDYNEAIQNPATSFEDDELRRGAAARNKLGIPKPITGNFATVYQVRTGPSVHAVRCFLRNVPDQRDRYELISRHLADARLRQTVEFSFIERGIRVKGVWYPILKMDWVTGTTLAAFVEEHLDDRRMLNKLAEAFLELLDDLRSHQIAHGDLQHGNLLVVDGRTGPALKLIDYDGMWVPALDGLRSNEVGHPNYQHPHRTGDEYGQTLDSFSAWVIVASLLAVRADPTVWSTVRPKRADDRLLLGKADYLDRDGSQPFRRLRVASDAAAKQAAERLLALCPPSEQVLGLPPPIAEDLSGGRAVQWVPGAPAPVTGEPWWKRARYAKSDAVSAAAVTTAWVAPATGVTTTTGSVAPGAPAGAAQVTTAAGAPAVSSAAAPPRPVTSSPASVAPPPPPAVYAPPQAGPVPVAATGPVPAAWTVASPTTSARTSIRKDILLTLLAVGIFAAVVVGAGKWGGVPATAPSMSPMPSPIAAATQAASPVAAAAPTARPTPTPTAAPVTPSPRPTPQPDTEARSHFSWVQWFYANGLAPCYAGSNRCAIDQAFEYTDGETWVPSSEFARITKLYVAPGGIHIGGESLCREALGSLFPPLMSIAVEIELLKKLRAGEAPPSNWSRVPGLSFEGCAAHDLATYRKRADQVRSSIHTLEQRLASLRTRLKKADVSGSRSASVALAVSAADLARRAARDEDLAAPAIWSSLRQVAWDTMRISAWASVPRVAKQPATLKLIDSTVAKIKSLALDGLWP